MGPLLLLADPSIFFFLTGDGLSQGNSFTELSFYFLSRTVGSCSILSPAILICPLANPVSKWIACWLGEIIPSCIGVGVPSFHLGLVTLGTGVFCKNYLLSFILVIGMLRTEFINNFLLQIIHCCN